VHAFPANGYGLYDMIGNVRERRAEEILLRARRVGRVLGIPQADAVSELPSADLRTPPRIDDCGAASR
jgi:hypothetical protein